MQRPTMLPSHLSTSDIFTIRKLLRAEVESSRSSRLVKDAHMLVEQLVLEVEQLKSENRQDTQKI